MSTIVIYEADDLMRGLLREWLTGAGYRVRAGALCGPLSHGEADLVIVNIGMPKLAGARVADEIRAAHPGTPMIAISAQFRADLSTAGTTAQTPRGRPGHRQAPDPRCPARSSTRYHRSRRLSRYATNAREHRPHQPSLPVPFDSSGFGCGSS